MPPNYRIDAIIDNQMNTLEKVQNIVQFEEQHKAIVQLIEQHRKQANLTQAQLADMIKVDRRKLIALKAGAFDVKTLLLAADLLGIKTTLNFEIH